MNKLINELRSRKVFRVAGLYVVIAWVIIQVAGELLPTFSAPSWVQQTLVLILLLCFPLALLLAWAYEVVPEGQGHALRPQPSPGNTSLDHKLLYATFALVLLVAGFQVTDRLLQDSSRAEEGSAGRRLAATAVSNEQVLRAIIPLGTVDLDLVFWPIGLSLSDDGRRLAYSLASDDQRQIFIRELDRLDERLLLARNSENLAGGHLQWGPDGERLVYWERDQHYIIDSRDGSLRPIGNLSTVGYATAWDGDDSLIVEAIPGGLRRLSLASGTASALPLSAPPNDTVYGLPHLLPGGRHLLYTSLRNLGVVGELAESRIHILDLDSGASRSLISDAYRAFYLDTGHILFMREQALWGVPFDLDTLEVIGAEVLLIPDIEVLSAEGLAIMSLSPSGDLLYLPETELLGSSAVWPTGILTWVDRSGAETPLDMTPRIIRDPRLSPDGTQVLLTITELPSEEFFVWRYDLERDVLSRVVSGMLAADPVWLPDGSEFVFANYNGLQRVDAMGTGVPEPLYIPPDYLWRRPTAVTADGQRLVFDHFNRDEFIREIYFLDVSSGEAAIAPFSIGSFSERSADLSPDNRWLAYVSDETGEDQVYVRPYPDVGEGKWQISPAGGIDPQWSPRGDELFFRRPAGGVEAEQAGLFETYVVPIETRDGFRPGMPRLLFTSDHYSQVAHGYDIAPDGQRLLMIKPTSGPPQDSVTLDINLVLVKNFAAEVVRRVPAYD